MSSYEDYGKVAGHYDATRHAVGTELILGCLAKGRTALGDAHLVDAGCGTGNYTAALVDYVGCIEAIDLNEGMLSQAKKKLAAQSAQGRVRFYQGSIDALPFADASVDGVILNQVLHHIADDGEAGWPKIRHILGEFSRVTRPGGVLVINTCSTQQINEGWWYYSFIPNAVRAARKRHVPLDRLVELMEDSGYGFQGKFVPVDGLMQGESYLNPDGPLDAHWRLGDSMWACADDEELAAALEKLRNLKAECAIEDYVKEHDQVRKSIGQLTFMFGVKRG